MGYFYSIGAHVNPAQTPLAFSEAAVSAPTLKKRLDASLTTGKRVALLFGVHAAASDECKVRFYAIHDMPSELQIYQNQQ